MKMSKLASSVLTLVLGILLVVMKDDIIGIAITVFGVALIVTGVLELLKRDLTSGIIKIVMGVAVLVIGWLLLSIALLILGIVLAVYGALDLLKAIFALGKQKGLAKKLLSLIPPAITVLAGVLLITGKALDWAILVAGIVLIIDGALALIDELMKK